MKSKFLFLCIFSLAVSASGFAQIQYIPASIHRFSISLGGGMTALFGDLKPKVFKPAARGNIDYNFTPFISAGIEGQYGTFAGGDIEPAGKTTGLYSQSNYYAVNANVRLGVGQFLPTPENRFSELLGGIYLGSGIGYVSSEVTTLVKKYPYSSTPLTGTFYVEANEILIPINLGVNMDLPVYRLGANLNFQYNITMSEALDGYDVNILSNNDNDGYGMVSLAIRYYFGGTH